MGSSSAADFRENQLASIREELKLNRSFLLEYNPKEDAIVINTKTLVLTLGKSQLDRDDYMDVVKYSYGRLMEAMDNNLLHMPVAGHA